MSEIEVLDGDGVSVTLVSGFQVNLLPMKTRQFFRLLRILTAGASPELVGVILTGEAPVELMVAGLLTSIPEAENQTIDFLVSMVEPIGIKKGFNLSKEDKEANDELWNEVAKELTNPEIEDSLVLVEAIVKNEAKHVESLGKRLRAMLEIAKKTGQLEKPKATRSRKSPVSNS